MQRPKKRARKAIGIEGDSDDGDGQAQTQEGLEHRGYIKLKRSCLMVNLGAQLGSGETAVVYKGYEVNSSNGRVLEKVAVKATVLNIRPNRTYTETEAYKLAVNELNCYRSMPQHPNIVRCLPHGQLDCCEVNGAMCYILPMERCGGNLLDLLNAQGLRGSQQAAPVLTYCQRKQLAHDVVKGLAHVHDHNIAMCDLKPHNILCKMDKRKGLVAKLAGFRLSKQCQEDLTPCNGVDKGFQARGSPSYMAPELSAHPATGVADIFSLGIIMYHVLAVDDTEQGAHCLPHPFRLNSNEGHSALQDNINYGRQHPQWLDKLARGDAEARNLIVAMLHRDPAMRPTIQEVLGHPFFCNLDHRQTWMHNLSHVWIKKRDHAVKVDKLFPLRRVFGISSWAPGPPFINDGPLPLCLLKMMLATIKGAKQDFKTRAAEIGPRLSGLAKTAYRNPASHLNNLSEEQHSIVMKTFEGALDDYHQAFKDELDAHKLAGHQPCFEPQQWLMYFTAKFPALLLCIQTACDYLQLHGSQFPDDAGTLLQGHAFSHQFYSDHADPGLAQLCAAKLVHYCNTARYDTLNIYNREGAFWGQLGNAQQVASGIPDTSSFNMYELLAPPCKEERTPVTIVIARTPTGSTSVAVAGKGGSSCSNNSNGCNDDDSLDIVPLRCYVLESPNQRDCIYGVNCKVGLDCLDNHSPLQDCRFCHCTPAAAQDHFCSRTYEGQHMVSLTGTDQQLVFASDQAETQVVLRRVGTAYQLDSSDGMPQLTDHAKHCQFMLARIGRNPTMLRLFNYAPRQATCPFGLDCPHPVRCLNSHGADSSSAAGMCMQRADCTHCYDTLYGLNGRIKTAQPVPTHYCLERNYDGCLLLDSSNNPHKLRLARTLFYDSDTPTYVYSIDAYPGLSFVTAVQPHASAPSIPTLVALRIESGSSSAVGRVCLDGCACRRGLLCPDIHQLSVQPALHPSSIPHVLPNPTPGLPQPSVAVLMPAAGGSTPHYSPDCQCLADTSQNQAEPAAAGLSAIPLPNPTEAQIVLHSEATAAVAWAFAGKSASKRALFAIATALLNKHKHTARFSSLRRLKPVSMYDRRRTCTGGWGLLDILKSKRKYFVCSGNSITKARKVSLRLSALLQQYREAS